MGCFMVTGIGDSKISGACVCGRQIVTCSRRRSLRSCLEEMNREMWMV